MPAHCHGKENQMLRMLEKPLLQRRAVCAQQVQGRTGSAALGKGSQCQGRSLRQWCPHNSLCFSSDKHGEPPASAPALQPRHSRAWLGPGSCSASHSPTVQSLATPPAVLAAAQSVSRSWPSSTCGSDSASAGTGPGCKVPYTALAEVL